jgi:hypothetical protein
MGVRAVQPREGFRLEVVFVDGRATEVALGDRRFDPLFEPLRDPSLFSHVGVDPLGAVCWPNGADLAPDALYRLAVGDA